MPAMIPASASNPNIASRSGLQQVLVFVGTAFGGGVVGILDCALWGE
jgi:hypothetical protein